jgi:hypothetical protein
MYVLDTNVISELRKGKKAERSVRMWAQALPTASLYFSVVSILELEIVTLLVERVTESKARFFGLGLMATSCLHSQGEFWRLILLWPSDAHHSMCQIPAPIGMPSSQQLRSCMAWRLSAGM